MVYPQDGLHVGIGAPNDRQATVMVLDKSSAGLHPIAAVAIGDTLDVTQFSMMDVAANDTVHPTSTGFVHERRVVAPDQVHGPFQATLQKV